MFFVKFVDFFYCVFTFFVEVKHKIFAYINFKCQNFDISLNDNRNLCHKFVYFFFIV